eukprot:6192858-Pleurochrysis_carterae.AAC.2
MHRTRSVLSKLHDRGRVGAAPEILRLTHGVGEACERHVERLALRSCNDMPASAPFAAKDFLSPQLRPDTKPALSDERARAGCFLPCGAFPLHRKSARVTPSLNVRPIAHRIAFGLSALPHQD